MDEEFSTGDRVTSRRLLAILACTLLLGSCAHGPGGAPVDPSPAAPALSTECPKHANLDGTLWVRSSAEYQAASMQVFRNAALQMEKALADPTWTAAIEQEPSAMADLPPAIIVDVDETILDNSPYQAYLIAEELVYDPQTWKPWIEQSAAQALSGAKEFLDRAHHLDVTVFYVTNRAADEEEATRRNLKRQRLPIEESMDTVMMKGENGWSSDKTSRRQAIAQTHRILLLLGDDLNDFVSGAKVKEPGTRRELAEAHASKWGERWFLLSNPTYGSWEASLFGRDYGLSGAEKLCSKRRHLKPFDPDGPKSEGSATQQ